MKKQTPTPKPVRVGRNPRRAIPKNHDEDNPEFPKNSVAPQKRVIEFKYYDSATNGTSISNVATVAKILTVPQGIGQAQRIGDELALVYHKMRYSFVSADTYNVCRLLIFQWNDNDSFNAPTAAKLLTNGSTGAIDVTSEFNPDNRDQYHIMYDRVHAMTTANNAVDYVTKERLIAPHSDVFFNIAATTGTNMLYYLAISDSVAVTHPQINMLFRTFYRDD